MISKDLIARCPDCSRTFESKNCWCSLPEEKKQKLIARRDGARSRTIEHIARRAREIEEMFKKD